MAAAVMLASCGSAPTSRSQSEPGPVLKPQSAVASAASSSRNALQETPEQATCLLTGVWSGEAWRINSRGPSRFHDRLEISCDAHGLLRAQRNWRTLEGAGGHKGMTPVKKDTEELIGVFNPENGEFHLVEMDEPGTIVGRMLDDNTIELVSTQPGRQPSTSREQLKRVEER